MNKKYKVILQTSAISAITLVGVMTTAVSCGKSAKENKKTPLKKGKKVNIKKSINKYTDEYIKKYRFDNKIFKTKSEAEKAREIKIDNEVQKELKDEKNKALIYKYNGKEYLTKESLLEQYKKENKIEEFLFSNTNKNKKLKSFKDLEQFIEKDSKDIFSFNKKLYKSKEVAIQEYLKNGNGDGSGKTFFSKLYNEKNKIFPKKDAVLGSNRKSFSGIGACDGRIYVTKPNIKKSFLQNISNLDFEKIKSPALIQDHSNEFSKYKDEFLKVIKEFERFQSEDGDDWYYFTLKAENMDTNTKLPSGHTLQSDLFLSDAREVSSWKTFWGITTGIVYKKKSYWTLKDEVNASKNLKDLDKVWKIFSSATWKLHAWTKSNGHTYRSVRLDTIIDWKTSWINNGYKPNGALNRYKNNTSFNFNRRFSFNDKWFKSKINANKESIKESMNSPKIRTKINFSKVGKIDFNNLNDLKAVASAVIDNTLNSAKDADNLFFDGSGISSENPLNSIKTSAGLIYVNELNSIINNISNSKSLLKIIETLSKAKLEKIKVTSSGVFTKVFTNTVISSDLTFNFVGFKFIYENKAYKSEEELLSKIMESTNLTGIFDGDTSKKITIKKLLENLNSKESQEKRLKLSIDNTKIEKNKNKNVELFDYETGTKAPSNASIGENKVSVNKVGDGSGNIYIKVKATENNIISQNPNTIIGKNFSADEIKQKLSENGEWNSSKKPNNSIKIIKQTNKFIDLLNNGDSIDKLPSVNEFKVGKILVKGGDKIKGDETVIFDKTNTQIFNDAISNIKATPSKKIFKGNVSKEIFSKKIREQISKKSEFKFIDEANILPNSKETFKDIKIPDAVFLGADGSAKIKKIDLGPYVSVEYKIKQKAQTIEKNFTYKIKEQKFQNGDELILVVKKDDNELIRRISINNLKINMLSFFKSTDKNIKVEKEKLVNSIKQVASKLIPNIKSSFEKMGDEFKSFLSLPMNERTDEVKLKLIKTINDTKKTIDARFFDMVASDEHSLINTFIQELEKYNVYSKNISDNGYTVKEEIKSEINDLLDILRVITDNTFKFISNSIYWNPSWKRKGNLIADQSNLESVINSNIDKDAKQFLIKLKENKNTLFGNPEEIKNESFKTILDIMKKPTSKFKVYKDVNKDGKITFYITKEINTREITNIFRQNYKMTNFRSNGTLDNIKIESSKLVGDIASTALDRAKKRAENDWKGMDSKNIDLNELYSKNGSKKDKNSTETSKNDSGNDFSPFIPIIKGLLNGSISNLLKNMGLTIDGFIGVSGAENIPSIFNNVTQSGFDSLINMENDIYGLLSHIVGDKGDVVISVEKNPDNKFVVKDYFSPQIRVIDKQNNNKITYRKDDLDQFFTRLKPFMDLIFEFLGSAGE